MMWGIAAPVSLLAGWERTLPGPGRRRKVVRPQLASLGPPGTCGRSTLRLGAAASRRSGRVADLIGAT